MAVVSKMHPLLLIKLTGGCREPPKNEEQGRRKISDRKERREHREGGEN
jgi:hypothetical protein